MPPRGTSTTATAVTSVVARAVAGGPLAPVPVLRQVLRQVTVVETTNGTPAKRANKRRATVRARLVVPAMDTRQEPPIPARPTSSTKKGGCFQGVELPDMAGTPPRLREM